MARARYCVSLPELGKEDFIHTYYCFAPAFFLAREPTHAEKLAFIDQLKSRYKPRALSEKAFQCVTCLRPAHQSVDWTTYALRDPGSVGSPGCLAVNDILFSTCKAASCAKKAQRSLDEYIKGMARRRGVKTWDPEIMSCRTCLRDFSDKLPCQACARCQATLYCSVECQKINWKWHKEQCKGRVEAAKLTADQLAQLDTVVKIGTSGTMEMAQHDHPGKLSPTRVKTGLGTMLESGQEAAVARDAKHVMLHEQEKAKLDLASAHDTHSRTEA